MSGSWAHVASVAELKERGALAVKCGEHDIGLFFVEGQVYAIDNLCTHGNACLTEGILEGHVVECPLHAGLVDVRSGKAVGEPITRDARKFRAKIEEDQVLIELVASGG